MSLIIESYHGLYGVQYIKVIMIHKRSHNPMYDKSSSSAKTHYTNIRKLFILIAPIKTTTRLILYCYVFIQPCLGRFKIIKSTIYIYIHTYWLKHISSYCSGCQRVHHIFYTTCKYNVQIYSIYIYIISNSIDLIMYIYMITYFV